MIKKSTESLMERRRKSKIKSTFEDINEEIIDKGIKKETRHDQKKKSFYFTKDLLDLFFEYELYVYQNTRKKVNFQKTTEKLWRAFLERELKKKMD